MSSSTAVTFEPHSAVTALDDDYGEYVGSGPSMPHLGGTGAIPGDLGSVSVCSRMRKVEAPGVEFGAFATIPRT